MGTNILVESAIFIYMVMDGGQMFFQYIDACLPDYKVLHPLRL
jgi:hypothetical protein